MASLIIVEFEVFGKGDSCFRNRFVALRAQRGLQVHLLVFDASPKAFDKHIVPPAALWLVDDHQDPRLFDTKTRIDMIVNSGRGGRHYTSGANRQGGGPE